jgi:beta-glucosidase
VYLKSGEEKRVTVTLPKSAFSYYNPEKGGWLLEPGKFKILVGSSSMDIRLEKEMDYID